MQTFILDFEGNRKTVEARDLDDAREQAGDLAAEHADVDTDQYGTETAVVRIEDAGGQFVENLTVYFDPDEPECEPGQDGVHEWGEERVVDLVDGTVITQKCRLCGMEWETRNLDDGMRFTHYR